MRILTFKDMLQGLGIVLAMLLFAGWVTASYADDMDVKYNGNEWYAIYTSSTNNTITNTSGAYSDMPFNAGSCEFTRTGTGDIVLTLQKSIGGTSWANVTTNHTLSPNDTNSVQFDFITKGGFYWRSHMISTVTPTDTVSVKCYLWRP